MNKILAILSFFVLLGSVVVANAQSMEMTTVGCPPGSPNKYSPINGLPCPPDNDLYFQTRSLGQQVLGVSSTNLNMTLKVGSYNAEVKVLQNKLVALGFLSGSVDGRFGPKTKAAVMKFQTANHLEADGVVGSKTRALLNQ